MRWSEEASTVLAAVGLGSTDFVASLYLLQMNNQGNPCIYTFYKW